MRSLILYGSATKLSKGHFRVTKTGNRLFPTVAYFVRAKIFNGNIDEALDKAKPRAGEVVLNTVPIQ